jgi:hypothetical protein
MTATDLTEVEVELIHALRAMPLTEAWCHELGFCVIGEDELGGIERGEVGWGNRLYFAFKAFAEERGEVPPDGAR